MWWVIANLLGIAAWLYIASRIWPWPPYVHCDFAPGDPFYFFGLVVPLFVVAAIVQIVALIVVTARAIRTRRKLMFLAVLLSAVAWTGAAAYDMHRGHRYVTDDCPTK